MRRIGASVLYIAAALVGIGVATIGALPATVAASIATDAANGQLVLANVSGSAFNGRADVTIRGLAPGQPPLTLHNIEWTIDKWPLLWGEMEAIIQSKGLDLKGIAELSGGGGYLIVRDIRFEMPASVVSAHVPEAKGWTTPGTVEVRGKEIKFTATGVLGAVELNWRGAQTPELGTLGEFRADLRGNGAGPIQVDLKTLQGLLRLDGRGEFTFARGLRMSVNVDIQGPLRDRFMPALSLIGRARSDGSVAIEINSQVSGRAAAVDNKS